MRDDENNPITCVTTVLPSFVTFQDSDCSYQIAPVNPSTSIGMFNLKGYITDTKMMTEYDFTIEVIN